MRRRSHRKKYKVLIPRTKEWPIVRLNKERRAFMDQIIEESYVRVYDEVKDTEYLRRLLEDTIYKERTRVAHYNWRVDRIQKESDFWSECAQLLLRSSNSKREEHRQCELLLRKIIQHYVHEMMGNFKPNLYQVITRMVTSVLMRLLNAVHLRLWRLLRGQRIRLYDQIRIVGAIDRVRKLARSNILIFVPTHFSNIDSIIVGLAAKYMGLPPLMYGAGINLFNFPVFDYLMHRLGAYKLDRRKRGAIYLDTLKIFTKGIIKYGCHALFYPGGTRSRSGSIETKLKLGLLSTAIAAQREFCTEKKDTKPKKVFVIPVVISYHFVLEGPSLIRNFLERSGKERYYSEVEHLPAMHKIFKFVLALFTKSSTISVSIGKGLDVLGNYINDKGESIDQHGKSIEIRDYFSLHGLINPQPQREYEYTKKLAAAIIKEYYRANQVLCSHVVAFVAFELITRQYPLADLYTLLRMPREDIRIPYNEFIEAVRKVQERIFELHAKDQIQYEPILERNPEYVFKKGIAYCGMYHSLRPLLQDKRSKEVHTEDLGRLYYYHNRLTGYEIELVL